MISSTSTGLRPEHSAIEKRNAAEMENKMGMPQIAQGNGPLSSTRKVIPMKKRVYRSVELTQVNWRLVAQKVEGGTTVGVDAAKETFFAALTNGKGAVVQTV